MNTKISRSRRNPIINKKGGIYIGNLPHGFYEKELRGFLGQFGTILRLKVARSPKNAAPMGYALVEFKHLETAQVVANTMNNYLMYEKILKCKLLDTRALIHKQFRKSNEDPEFCLGTLRRKRNQFLMQRRRKGDYVKTKREVIAKKINYIEKSLGIKINPCVEQNDNMDKKEKKRILLKSNELSSWTISKKIEKSVSDKKATLTKSKEPKQKGSTPEARRRKRSEKIEEESHKTIHNSQLNSKLIKTSTKAIKLQPKKDDNTGKISKGGFTVSRTVKPLYQKKTKHGAQKLSKQILNNKFKVTQKNN